MKSSFAVLFIALGAVLAGGCSTKPRDTDIFPDGGATTAELLTGVKDKVTAYFGTSAERADYLGHPLVEKYTPNSSRSLAHIDELRRDFHQVPNPEITAYVFPHLNDGEMPVPGYFTIFNLYDTDHYALEQEGHHVRQ